VAAANAPYGRSRGPREGREGVSCLGWGGLRCRANEQIEERHGR